MASFRVYILRGEIDEIENAFGSLMPLIYFASIYMSRTADGNQQVFFSSEHAENFQNRIINGCHVCIEFDIQPYSINRIIKKIPLKLIRIVEMSR